jgi:putative sterol carrier protein
MPRFSTVAEIFEAMPQHFLPDAAAGMNAVIQLDLSGEGGGQWNLTVANQQLKVSEGQAANPNLTLKLSAADYLSMINGDANAMQMFMQGKVKVGGDMSLALKMQNIFKMQ